MLKKIFIKNIVLIENLEINFTTGLSVLTGETGTGKSIIIDSLGLILGNRANFKLIRHGENKASVTGIFEILNNYSINNLLSSLSIETTNQLILRREISINGKSTAFVNDVPVSLNTLQRIGNILVEIQGQFENHSLLKEYNHLSLLDLYCDHSDLIKKVEKNWYDFSKKKQELEEAQSLLNKNKTDQEWIKDALNQLEKINPVENEESDLLHKRKILINQDKIISSLELARQILDSEEGLNNQIQKLSSILSKLNEIEDQDLKSMYEMTNETRLNLEELSSSLNLKSVKQNHDEQNLDYVEDRLHELRKQANKHKCKIEDLVKIQRDLNFKLTSIETNESKIIILNENLIKSLTIYEQNATKLSQERKRNAQKMIENIDRELPSLKLEDAVFKINFERFNSNNYNKTGFDKVTFKAKTNLGSDLGNLKEIASGGELSRFLLAIKVVIENNQENKTLIFDEVDSGIGGATASAVGEKLSKIGEKYQTIVVTHSPQVAAKSSHHYLIKKETLNKKAITYSNKLNENERVEEIARMLSDNKVTFEARNAAKKLLE